MAVEVVRVQRSAAPVIVANPPAAPAPPVPPPPPPPPTTETTPDTTAAASDEVSVRPDGKWMVIAVVVMLLGIAIGSALNYLVDAVTVDLNEGFNEFALFYLIAQAIERFAEFTSYIPWIGARSSGGGTTQRREQDTTGADVGTQLDATKANVTKLRNKARALSVQELAKGNFNAATVKAQEAADRQEDVQVVRANRAVFFLGLNTAIAAVACGYFKLLLLKHVGVNGAGDWLDIAVTAFAIGGGTKPLHDLIKNIQKAKEQGQDSTATT